MDLGLGWLDCKELQRKIHYEHWVLIMSKGGPQRMEGFGKLHGLW